MSTDSVIAKNIKFFRTKNGYSQEQLANLLKMKRANIAAYESKGVEPRLRILNEMSKIFNVSFEWFLCKDLSQEGVVPTYGKKETDQIRLSSEDFNIEAFKVFVDRSTQIRKVLEGFKAYNRLLNRDSDHKHSESKLSSDLENFTQLLEQLLIQNETFITSFNRVQNIEK